MRYEHNKVRECMNQKEGNYVSEVTGTCHIITTENIRRDFKKHGNNSFHVIPKDTLFSVFDTFQKGPPVSNFGDTGSISLSKRDYNDNASSEKAIILQALNSRAVPQCIQATQINTTERAHKTNTNSQDTIIEKKQMFNINSFSLKGKFNSFLDIEQEVKLVHCDTLYIGPNAMTKTQEEFVGDFLSEWKEKIQNLIWNERKHPTESLTGMHSFQISNGSKIEREQKYSITTTNTMVCILKSNLLMKKKPNLEDAREINQIHGNQNNTTDRNEHQTLLQESALANSKLFHLNNESTEFVNRKFKTDLATRNNEYSPDLRAECLSTETKTMTDFEMKSKFDIVLKELCMFHEIGKEEETSLIGETRNSEEKNDFDKDNSTEEVHQVIKEDFTVVSMEKICVPSLPCDTIISVNMPKTIQSSFKWKKLHRNREKEVPHEYCSSSPSDEELLHSPSGRDFEKAFSQNPALFSDAFMEGRIHSLLKGATTSSFILFHHSSSFTTTSVDYRSVEVFD
ncbi:RAD51-associated protein 2 [Phascolarctos cinereus]